MQKYTRILIEEVSIAPLFTFRILFGALMLFALLRNLFLGFVHKFYIEPEFYFKYPGFEWVQATGVQTTYILYSLLIISSMGILLGAFYRISAIVFFLLFSFFELLDLTHYLNHYYLISLVSFLLIFLPANRACSVDTILNSQLKIETIPRWTILILQFQIGLVYFYAGIAKLHPDWLFHAQPLKIWLSRLNDFPVIGQLLIFPFTAYFFAWFSAIYDLFIPFLLCNKSSRIFAFAAVLIFHFSSGILFNIGIFPAAMVVFSLIFFSEFWHKKFFSTFELVFILTLSKLKQGKNEVALSKVRSHRNMPFFIWVFVFWQLLFPLRHWLYPGNVLWTEEGFRFAWNVMVVEKTGSAQFRVIDQNGKMTEVNNRQFLSEKQEVFMSYQPDMILQFAHFLAKEYRKKGYKNPKVYVDCFVTLNGRTSRRFIDPNTDLAAENIGIFHKPWILLYKDL